MNFQIIYSWWSNPDEEQLSMRPFMITNAKFILNKQELNDEVISAAQLLSKQIPDL